MKWMKKEEKFTAAGRISTGNITFVIRLAFSNKMPTDLFRLSEKINQGKNPARKKIKKLSVPVSLALIGILRTSEKM